MGLEIRGSTLLVDIFKAYPGAGAELSRKLYWPCAHCGGAVSEPLTMAAIRHRNPPRAVLEASTRYEIKVTDGIQQGEVKLDPGPSDPAATFTTIGPLV